MGGKKKDRKNAKKASATAGRSQQSAEDESNPSLADLQISSPSEVESNPDEFDYTESDSVTDSASKASSPPLLSPSSDKSDLEKQPSPDDIKNEEDFPARVPGVLSSLPTGILTVHVNYFEIKFDPKITIYNQYSVDIKMVTKNGDKDCPKTLRWKAMEAYRLKVMPDRHPAYDGDKMMVAAKPLKELPDETVTIEDTLTRKPITLRININNVNKKVKLESIRQFANEKTKVAPREAMQCLDWILHQAGYSNYLKVGRNYYTGELTDLEDGMTLWQGLFQSTYLGECGVLLPTSSKKTKRFADNLKPQKLYLNVDAVYKAFAKPQSIEKLMEDDLRINTEGNYIDRKDIKKLQDYLKGLKIIYSVPQSEKGAEQKTLVYIVRAVAQPANALSFTYKEQKYTVANYMHKEKKRTLKHAGWPCLEARSGDRTIYLPIELCSVAKNQVTTKRLNETQKSTMILKTAVKPSEREKIILTQLTKLDLNQNPCMKEFGITVETSMTSVKGWRIDYPVLFQIDPKKEKPNKVIDGFWELEKFKDSGKANINLAIVDLLEGHINNITEDQEKLYYGVQAQLFLGNYLGSAAVKNSHRIWPGKKLTTMTELGEFLKEKLANKKYDLVIILIHQNIGGEDPYGTIKQIMDQELKLVSQCILRSNAAKAIEAISKENKALPNSLRAADIEKKKFSQIMLKINAKLGGTNFGFDVLLRDSYIKPRTMIMGADVTHPGAGSTNVPSFAAVTASYDEDFFRYHMNWRVQPPREEIIADLKEMTKEHLLYYYNHSEKEKPNQKRPQYIVFYRDGVSDTQFAEVKRKELAAIQEACKEVAKQYKWEEDFKPIITFLVVQKRNHARFFPVCPNNKTPAGVDPKQGNVKSGFVVDTIITHPWQIDFFLVSQNAGKGTACPARYRLLFDGGIKINELEIKRMTFYLCFLYARCNQSVSYPAPTYYAHLAAARVKLYCNNKFDDIDTSAGRDKEEIYRDWKAATDRVNDETVKNMKTFIDNNPMYYV